MKVFENDSDSGFSVDLGSADSSFPESNGYLRDNTTAGSSAEIYNLWLRKFANNEAMAELEWEKFREIALDKYNKFSDKLKELENNINGNVDSDEYLDISFIIQKKENIDAMYIEIEDHDKEFSDLSKTFEKLAQYSPKGVNRNKVKLMIRTLRERYFYLLQELHRKKEILRWNIPRLKRYKSSGSEVKMWLDSVESRSEVFISCCKKDSSILPSKEAIDGIADELNLKKDVYEDFIEAGEGILGIGHEMQMEELSQDIENVSYRWDTLCSNIEHCLNKLKLEQENISLEMKSDIEKIDITIQDESQMCTCSTPFKIVKVGEGKYTFGASKTTRLLRIHGSCIVVRVGGGWEYLHDFLMKVDPCRAKQHATTPNKAMDSAQLSRYGLKSLDKNSFSIPVKRMSRSSWATSRNQNRSFDVLSSAVSVDHLDGREGSFESLNLAGSSSTPSTADLKGRQTSAEKNNGISSPRKYGANSKLYQSTENLSRKKSSSDCRRISLVDRQKLYAQKRSMTTQSTEVLNI